MYVDLGVSIVKWTILEPCKGWSGSDSKLHTNFEFNENENYLIILRHIDFQGQALYIDKKKASKIVYIIQKRVQVMCRGEIKQIVV